MSFDPATAALAEADSPAIARSGFDPATALEIGFDPATAAPEPEGSAVVDFAKRFGRAAVAGAGGAVASVGRLNRQLGGLVDRINDTTTEAVQGFPLTDEQRATRAGLRDQASERFGQPDRAAVAAGEAMKGAAAGIETDPARNGTTASTVAEVAGSVAPVVAAGLVNPVAGFLTATGTMADAARSQALAAGDSPDVAEAKGVLGAAVAAPLAVVPALPVRSGAAVVERIATRIAEGATVNAAGDVAMQAGTEDRIDWGRVRQSGAIGAGLGLVLSVPEALALRRAFGSKTPHEGKPLARAIDEIASESGQSPTAIQERINGMVGIAEPAPAARPGSTAAAIDAATGVPSAAGSAEETLFAARLRRQDDTAAAFGEESGASVAQRREDFTRAQGEELQTALSGRQGAGPESVTLGNDAVKNQITELDTRPGNAAKERARLADRGSEIDAAAPSEPRLSAQASRMADQYGGIDLAALIPVARSAVGGALGYASGDTPEERVRNALLGMGFGAAASPALAKRLAAAVINAPVTREVGRMAARQMIELRLKMAPQSLLPEEVRTQLRWGDQATQAVTSTGVSLTRDMERAIRGIGDKAAQSAAAKNVQDYLTGAAPIAVVPGPVRVQAEKVRNFVDSLTDRAVSEGVVSGPMANTFLANRGSYLRRSYEIFLNPDWRPAPAVVRSAIDAVAQSNGITRAEAEGIVAGILDKNSRATLGDFLLGRGKLGGKDVGSLVRRQDLLPEVRALLGEVTDPVLAVNQTIPRLARLIENDAAQKRVRDTGLRLGLFSDARSLTHPTPIVAEGSATHDVLAGLFTQPEIAAAMQREAGRAAFVPEVLWKTLTTATTVAKMSKTVLNPESYAPNFIGGIIANVGNGNFRYSHAGRGLALGAEEMGVLRRFLPTSPQRDALRAELAELHRLGVVGESVNGQDLLRTIESSFFGKLRDRAASVLTLPARVYGGVDDFNRYVAWQSERARYAQAFPGMAAPELSRYAAEVVRSTTPVYSEVPRVIKQLSIAGLAPSFVNFTWEVFRNTGNAVRIGLRDLREGQATGNAALMRAGASRIAAITSVTAAASAWGLSKLSRDSNGIDDSKDAAIRYFSPPWNRDGLLLYQGRAERGRPVQVANASYLLPHALLWQAIEAGRRGLSEGEAVPAFLGALNEQFGFGNSVLIPAVAGAVQGFDPKTGRQIPSTAAEPTTGDRARYLASEAFMPLAIAQAERWKKAFAGEPGDYGRVYSVDEQMKRLFAVRAQTLDPIKAMQWRARDLAEKFHRSSDVYHLRQRKLAQAPATPGIVAPGRAGSAVRSPVASAQAAEELESAYRLADTDRRVHWEEVRRMIGHAKTLGVNDEQIVSGLRAARISAPDILSALDGEYRPLPRNAPATAADRLAELRARPAEQRSAELAKIYRDDPAMGRAVVSRLRAEAKGRTEADKLLLSLGVEDGERAAYLRRKLPTLPDTPARRAWLIDLRRKEILTDRVFDQMTRDPRRRGEDTGSVR